MIRVIVFDFDGTLVDSNRIKWRTYAKLFPRTKEIRKVITRIDLINGTRWQIIENFLVALKEAGFMEYDDLNKQVVKLGDVYTKIVEEEIVHNDGKQGAFSTLWKLRGKFPVYINTGTPIGRFKKLINKLIKSKKIPKVGIYGRGDENTEREAKENNLSKIIKNEKVLSTEVAVIGDREIDRQAAKKFGCFFIGVADEFNGWLKIKKDFPVITDLRDTLDHIK